MAGWEKDSSNSFTQWLSMELPKLRNAFWVLLDHHAAKCLQRKVKGEVTAIWRISALDHTILRKCHWPKFGMSRGGEFLAIHFNESITETLFDKLNQSSFFVDVVSILKFDQQQKQRSGCPGLMFTTYEAGRVSSRRCFPALVLGRWILFSVVGTSFVGSNHSFKFCWLYHSILKQNIVKHCKKWLHVL